MAWQPAGANPFIETMLTNHRLQLHEQLSVKYFSQSDPFHWLKLKQKSAFASRRQNLVTFISYCFNQCSLLIPENPTILIFKFFTKVAQLLWKKNNQLINFLDFPAQCLSGLNVLNGKQHFWYGNSYHWFQKWLFTKHVWNKCWPVLNSMMCVYVLIFY